MPFDATDGVVVAFFVGLSIALFLFGTKSTSAQTTPSKPLPDTVSETDKPKSMMSPENPNLAPPKSDPFTPEALAEYDGRGDKIYVAIKGTVFDVSAKGEMYGPGKSYNIFAGKDGSRGLGKSSLKVEDAVADYSVLDEKDMKTLNDWYIFFEKRYNIVGKVVSDSTGENSNL